MRRTDRSPEPAITIPWPSTSTQIVCSITALPVRSAIDRLDTAMNFLVSVSRAATAARFQVPANLRASTKAAPETMLQ